MSATENKKLLQGVFAATAEGDFQPWIAALADDVRWILTGSTPFSRTYEGKAEVMAKLLGPLQAQIDGRLRLTAVRMVGEGDTVVVEARGQSVTRAGQPYNNTYCMVFRLEGGAVRELTEYMDTALVNTTFARRPPAEAARA
jgi:uncharacterized protein